MLHTLRIFVFVLLLLAVLALARSYTTPIAKANDQYGGSINNLGKSPITLQVPSAPLGDFVYDVILAFKSTQPWSPNSTKLGRLAGLATFSEGARFIRAKAYNLRWTQQAKDWILANNNGGGRFAEVTYHTFFQDPNGALNAGCISTFTQIAPDWVGTNIPAGVPFRKDGCAIPLDTRFNEMRVTVTRPQDIVVNAKYETWVWWRDDPERDLGEVPLAFVWSNNDQDHTNIGGFPDDNVRKFCFGDDEGKAWGPSVFNARCHDGAPVRLFSGVNYAGTDNGFTGNDHFLPDNDVGNDNTRSIRINLGWEARLYEHSNYVGNESIIVANDSDLSNNQVGYGASSAKAIARGAVVYEHQDFTGVSEVFSGCDPNLSNNAIGDNRITSVQVPPGWRIDLWEHPEYGGKKLSFQGIDDRNVFDNKNFNDIASSLCVGTPAEQLARGEVGDWTGTDD